MSEDNTNPENTSLDIEQACDELFGRDQDLRTALNVIVAAYRIHHIATLAIERIVGGEGLPVAAVKMLTSAGASKAKSGYYAMDALLTSVQDEVLPFLKSEFTVQAELKRTHDLETQMVDRTVSAKPPVTVILGETVVELDRGHVVLAVGDKVKLVKGLADMMFHLAAQNENPEKANVVANVVNFSAMEDPPQIKQTAARIMRIPLRKWQYIANSHAKLRFMLAAISVQLAQGVCDLIIVDDGNQLFNGVHGREPCYDLEDGLRTLRRVATELNAAVVCLAPIPPDSEDYAALLKTHLQKHTVYIEV